MYQQAVSAEAFGDLKRQCDSHQRDLYVGNGVRSVRERLTNVENRVEGVQSDIAEMRERLQFGSRLMITTAVSALVAAGGVLVMITLHLWH